MSHSQEPRRRFLRQVLAVVPASTLAAGGAATQTACSSDATSAATASSGPYKPTYLNAAEWTFVTAAVDRLIPADELGPGAVQAGVPEFVDRQMETPYGHGKLWYMDGPFHTDQVPELGYQLSLTPRDIYRKGIANCDAWCQQKHGKTFADLDHATQEQVLKDLQDGKIELPDVPAKTFFGFLLTNTKEGFLSDPIYGGNKGMVGWKMLGFPGARADYMDWIDQPNKQYPYGPVSISGEKA